jgi:hypothetical protein
VLPLSNDCEIAAQNGIDIRASIMASPTDTTTTSISQATNLSIQLANTIL